MALEELKQRCLDYINVRKGTKVICLMNMNILFLVIVYNVVHILGEFAAQFSFSSKDELNESPFHMMFSKSSILNETFLEFLYLHFNIKLKQATEKTNIHHIKNWLTLHFMFLVYMVIFFCCKAYAYDQASILIVGFCCCAVVVLMLSVVKRFYRDEIVHADPDDDTAVLHHTVTNGFSVNNPTIP